MPVVSQAVAKIVVEGDSEAKSKLSDVKKSADDTQGGFKGMLQGMLQIAGGMGVFKIAGEAFDFLKGQVADVFKVTMEHQGVLAQTAQAIKSTGDASGMTADALGNLASSLSHVTDFSGDTIQSGENLLLTFTGIGKDVFPQATKTLLDMSQAMGGDVKSSAIQLGKALNDPAQGLTALTRVGVTFSESQKEAIKNMVAAGNTAGAQKIMLAELQREFGGSAEAAGKTFGGQLQILKNRLDETKEKIGTALLPVLTQLASGISSNVLPILDKFADWFINDAIPAINGFKNNIDKVFTYVENVLKSINLSDFKDAWQAVSGEVGYVARKFGDLFNAASPLGKVLKEVGTDADPIAEVIGNLARGSLGIVSGLLWDISGAFIAVTKQTQSGKGPLIDFFNSLSNIGNLLKGELGKELKDLGQDAKQVGDWFMSSVVPAIKQAMPGFENLGNTILNTVVPAVIQIRGVFVDVIQHAFEKFAPIIEKIVPPLIKFAGILANDVANGLKFIMPYIEQAATAIGKFADEIMDRVAPIVKGWIEGLTPLVKAFADWWNKNWPAMQQVLKGVWDAIVGVVKIAWSIVSGIIKIGLDIIGGNWGQAWNDMKDMLGGIWDGIKSVLGGAWEIVQGMFQAWISDALNAGSNIVKGIADGIKGAIKFVQDAIGSVAQWISDHLPHSPAKIGPLRDLHLQGQMITQQVSEGMLANIPKLNTAIGQLVKPISVGLNAQTGGLSGLASSMQFPAMQSAQSSSSQVQTVNLQIDSQTFARLVLPAFTDQIRHQVGVWDMS